VEFRFIDIDTVRTSQADLAVVIDVLRAFTTAPWAHHQGADEIWLAASSAEALNLKSELGSNALALKDGQPRDGFELANSPEQISGMDLTGHKVVQQTTNGTVGIIAAGHVPLVLAASFVNASATAATIRDHRPASVDFVITGDNGRADEDLAAADLIRELIEGPVDPTVHESRIIGSAAASRLREMANEKHPGVGPMDIQLASQTDRLPVVMRARRRDLGTCLEFSKSTDERHCTVGE
jgi:2-phosphosulfolactate phosphatase